MRRLLGINADHNQVKLAAASLPPQAISRRTFLPTFAAACAFPGFLLSAFSQALREVAPKMTEEQWALHRLLYAQRLRSLLRVILSPFNGPIRFLHP